MRVLAGDVGGTHARLGLFEVGPAGPRARARRVYESRDYPTLAPIVLRFLEEEVGPDAEPPDAACFGLACPVVEGTCELSNLDWVIEREALGRDIGMPDVRLINDFDAIGHGLACLGEEDVAELQAGDPVARAPMATIGAGTGLGQGYLTWDERSGRYAVHPSEGGHVDFAPRTELEAALWAWLRERFAEYGHVSYERVVSGPGLVDTYEFLVASGRGEERPATREAMEREDAARVISARGADGTDSTCARALEVFVSAFGAQAGNLALTVLARGGLWVAGGIAPDLLPSLREGPFLEAFRSKGRMTDVLREIPVRVVLREDVGLLGAAVAATHSATDRPEEGP